MKIKVTHFRIPKFLSEDFSTKGKPRLTFQYSRNHGWENHDIEQHKKEFERNRTDPKQINPYRPHEYGGETTVEIFAADTEKVVARGIATCSMADHFNYKKGYQIALGRAMKELEK